MQTRTRPMHRRLSLAALALLVAMGRTATAADEGMDRVRKSDLSQEAELSESMTQTLDLIRAEQDVELFQMGELVPSAEQPLKPTTSVYEITAQDILDQNARSVADALRFVPGLYLSVGGGKNPSNPIVRGLTIRQNVVFVDGRPVYDPFFGDIDLNNLPIDNVEKIKVVKGPVESAYGPNAIGAVINIVTKRGTSVPTTRLTASYESHNTQDYWLQHGGKKGGFNYFLAGSYRRSNTFPLGSDFTPTPAQPNADVRDNAAFTKGNLSLNLGYDFTERDRIALLAGYYSADLENPVNTSFQSGGRVGPGLNFTDFPTWKRQYVDFYGTTRPLDALELRGNVYYDRFTNDLAFYSNQTFTQNTDISRDTNDVYGTNLQAALDLTRQMRVKAGTYIKQDQHRRENVSPPSNEEQNSLTTDYFIEMEYTPVSNLLLSAGYSYDVLYAGSRDTITSQNPRGSIVYQPFTSTRLHAAVGDKSRLPRLLNLYSGIGNPTLKPERNFSVEAGGSQWFWKDRVELGVTWFRNKLDDVIGFVRLPGNVTQDQNITSLLAQGIEVGATATLLTGFSVSADYTYTSVDYSTAGQPPGNTYYHQANARVICRTSYGLEGFVQASYVDGSPFTNADFSAGRGPSYTNFFFVNGKLSYEVHKGVKPYVAIENLLNSNYYRTPGFPESGRRIFIGVNATFCSGVP